MFQGLFCGKLPGVLRWPPIFCGSGNKHWSMSSSTEWTRNSGNSCESGWTATGAAALADATGITDESVLTELVDAEISCETLYALSLFPLVWVAWSDGSISREQRKTILEAARAAGHESDAASHHLIEKWLDEEPSEKLVTAWKDYITAMRKVISDEARRSLRDDALQRARQIAEMVTGRYGFQAAEHAQDVVLRQIEKAYDAD